MMIFWIALIAALVFWIVQSILKNRIRNNVQESALNILKNRYARGEISKAEFEERKKDLL